MDLRRVERLIALARREHVTRLRLTPDGGVEIELGASPAEPPTTSAPRPSGLARRSAPRDTRSVDDFLEQRFKGRREGN